MQLDQEYVLIKTEKLKEINEYITKLEETIEELSGQND
jgi:hypothetical protein